MLLEALIGWSIRHRLVVLLGALVLIVVGGRAFQTLPIDAVPDLTNVQVQVLTNAPSLGPLDIERRVTAPVEFAMSGIPRVTEIRSLRAEGHAPRKAALEGSLRRLRPVLTTALVASLGFLPMAIASGASAEVQRPLATVLLGGLLTSTLPTLLVLPTVYAWFMERAGASPQPTITTAAEVEQEPS